MKIYIDGNEVEVTDLQVDFGERISSVNKSLNTTHSKSYEGTFEDAHISKDFQNYIDKQITFMKWNKAREKMLKDMEDN